MLDFLSSTATTIVSFLLVLTAVVTVHELGHFLSARSFGVVSLGRHGGFANAAT